MAPYLGCPGQGRAGRILLLFIHSLFHEAPEEKWAKKRSTEVACLHCDWSRPPRCRLQGSRTKKQTEVGSAFVRRLQPSATCSATSACVTHLAFSEHRRRREWQWHVGVGLNLCLPSHSPSILWLLVAPRVGELTALKLSWQYSWMTHIMTSEMCQGWW